MTGTLSPEALRALSARLDPVHNSFQKRYPGAPNARQPVHTYYEAAHLFRSDTVDRVGKLALDSLEQYAADFILFAKIVGLPLAGELPESTDEVAAIVRSIERDPETARRKHRLTWLAYTVYQRVLEKLRREPVEDLRIDFEDGYGNRSHEEEDRHAISVANDLASAMLAHKKFPTVGIRIKPFSRELHLRSVRTLDLFSANCRRECKGSCRADFSSIWRKCMFRRKWPRLRIFVRISKQISNSRMARSKSN